MNLTAITDPEDVASLHFLDSAALLTLADLKDKTVVDVGTGAGFPGMPLKILEPSIRMTLLDSLGKRITFLQEVATTDRSWVIISRVTEMLASSLRISCRICPCVTTSSAVVASSITRMRGWNISAMAMDVR